MCCFPLDGLHEHCDAEFIVDGFWDVDSGLMECGLLELYVYSDDLKRTHFRHIASSC